MLALNVWMIITTAEPTQLVQTQKGPTSSPQTICNMGVVCSTNTEAQEKHMSPTTYGHKSNTKWTRDTWEGRVRSPEASPV